ncbi:MAG: tRNA uracil 4-sulfurtransferase ThiI [Candidatus Helarchaeota archaeon]
MILIRYGEIALKSPRIRLEWEKQLIRNIKSILELNNISYKNIKFLPTRGRIFLDIKLTSNICSLLKKVSGIISFSEVLEASNEINSISKVTLKLADQILENGDTFALKVRRTGTHNYSSIDIARIVGKNVLTTFSDRNISVNLSSPKRTIYIEIRDKNSYIFHNKISGMGGLPIGTQGKVIALISGGIDSPVAAWMMMKRGCYIRPIYFDNYPYLSKKNIDKVINLIKKLRTFDPRKKFYFYIIPHGPNLELFLKNAPKNYTCLLCKRMLYRIAEVITKKEKAKAIVTGENLGQVASQTIDNLYILNDSIKIPVFRPLIGLDKEEIIDIAKKIGTFKISTEFIDSCTAVPKFPITKGDINKVIKFESDINIDNLVKNAINNMKKVYI